jgi:hypothetical protein
MAGIRRRNFPKWDVNELVESQPLEECCMLTKPVGEDDPFPATPDHIERLWSKQDRDTGLSCAVYKVRKFDGTYQIVVAFAGTKFSRDKEENAQIWRSNLDTSSGLVSREFLQAVELGDAVRRLANGEDLTDWQEEQFSGLRDQWRAVHDLPYSFTGHSRGGYLGTGAMMCAFQEDKPASWPKSYFYNSQAMGTGSQATVLLGRHLMQNDYEGWSRLRDRLWSVRAQYVSNVQQPLDEEEETALRVRAFETTRTILEPLCAPDTNLADASKHLPEIDQIADARCIYPSMRGDILSWLRKQMGGAPSGASNRRLSFSEVAMGLLHKTGIVNQTVPGLPDMMPDWYEDSFGTATGPSRMMGLYYPKRELELPGTENRRLVTLLGADGHRSSKDLFGLFLNILHRHTMSSIYYSMAATRWLRFVLGQQDPSHHTDEQVEAILERDNLRGYQLLGLGFLNTLRMGPPLIPSLREEARDLILKTSLFQRPFGVTPSEGSVQQPRPDVSKELL